MISLPQHIAEAIDKYLPSMEGWCVPERGKEMAQIILSSKAEVCVEIGTYAGRSLIAMGFAVREQGFGHAYGIDPYCKKYAVEGDKVEENAAWWRDAVDLELIHRQAMQSIWNHNLDPWVTIIRNASQYVAQLFPEIDVLNIDGAHSELVSTRDVELYLPRVASGGYVLFDDSSWQTTQAAIKKIEESCDLISDTGNARTYMKR